MDSNDARVLRDALAGDQYDWLVDILPIPAPVACPKCGTPMALRTSPALLSCPACFPDEVTGCD